MKTGLAAALVLLAAGSIGSQGVSACGDKFLLLGRGMRFQRAYAAIHPAAILLVAPPKSVKVAAVRDPRLRTALKMAGHRVDVVSPAGLRDALSGSRYDIILAERADAFGLPDALPAGPGKPSVIGVMEDPAAADLTVARKRLDAVITTPQPLPDILRLLDDVMKTRIAKSRVAAS